MIIKDKSGYDYPMFDDLKAGAFFRVDNTYYVKICAVTNQRDVTYNAVDIEHGIPAHIDSTRPVKRIIAEVVMKQ